MQASTNAHAENTPQTRWDKRVSAKICNFLRFSANIYGFLRFSAKECCNYRIITLTLQSLFFSFSLFFFVLHFSLLFCAFFHYFPRILGARQKKSLLFWVIHASFWAKKARIGGSGQFPGKTRICKNQRKSTKICEIGSVCPFYCATPSAEPRHEIFFIFFSRLFSSRAPCQAGTNRTLWRVLLLFRRAHFVEKLGTHSESIANSTETAVKLRKNVAWCEILRKRPCKGTRTPKI